jgi:hypothetical protein
MARLLLAVLAGYALIVITTLGFFLLSGRDSHAAQPAAFMALSVVVGVVAALAGGYLAVHLSGRPSLAASRLLALVIALGAAASLVTAPGAIWSPLIALFLMTAAAMGGGILRRRRALP